MDRAYMDIEGSEQLALKGGWRTIEKFKPHLVIKIHPRLLEDQFGTRAQEIYDDFRALGYVVFHIEGDRLVASPNLDILPWKDYFFLYPSRPHRLPVP